MASLPLVVVETESGAEVRLRSPDGETVTGEQYASLREALDSLLSDDDFRPKSGILRSESGERSGVWRWLDATAEEAAPADDGSQVTRELIATMAARLNSSSPAPMDGGSSEAHAQLSATSTAADGYAHVGVEALLRERQYPTPPDGLDEDAERAWEAANPPTTVSRWHLFLYCELDAETARKVDSGRLAYGSIGFTSDGRLLQHALTNVPAVEGLRPNNSVRGAPRGVRISFRSMRISMPTSPANVAKRGPALDLLAKIAGALGVSVEDEMSAESYESPVMSALSSIKMAAQAEKVLEQAAGGTPAPAAPAEASAATATQRTDAPVPAPDAAPRADAAFPDAAAMELFASEALSLLREVLGKPDAPAAEVLDLAKASKAAFAGAIGQGAPPADPAAMSAPAADAARTAAIDASKRALEENAKLRADIAKRDLRDAIGKRAVTAKATLTDAQLDELVTDALLLTDAAARERCIVRGLRAAQSVPTGEVLGTGAPSAGSSATTFRDAWRSLMPEVAAANPKLTNQHHVSLAQRAARERFPHLVDA